MSCRDKRRFTSKERADTKGEGGAKTERDNGGEVVRQKRIREVGESKNEREGGKGEGGVTDIPAYLQQLHHCISLKI